MKEFFKGKAQHIRDASYTKRWRRQTSATTIASLRSAPPKITIIKIKKQGEVRIFMTVFAGLDVHKKYFHATVLEESGNVLVQKNFPNSSDGYDSLLAVTGKDVEVALEATYAWEYVFEELEDRVEEIKLAHPKRTEAITKERIKTDVKASEALAKLLRMGWLPEAWAPPKETRRVREKLRRRAYLVWKRTGFKNKIKADLAKLGIRKKVSYSDEGREWLRDLEVDSINDYLDMIEALNDPIERITKEVRREARATEDAKLLMTIPGVGFVWSLTLTIELGDLERFSNPNEVPAQAGIVPSTEESGSKSIHGSITKEGNKYLRWAAVECAYLHKRYADDTHLKRFFHKLAAKKNDQTAAVATGRKILIVAYWMLTRKEEFRPRG
ncbi:hypothetical protein AKJ62_02805 [candidate division MSBL1 archaeon SCGC-AAA259D14]|uniref:Uncharacterized protein n=1 Tax=candidate division MSBL1 archaeon SCGC-AAA259D14 TaxID=1698261 RepID=A0A133U5X2_9EURY|nr:hypothetical protein AKJ62_02805 [candidate division MSBL1 archaeon SCGC-AAA259D14]